MTTKTITGPVALLLLLGAGMDAHAGKFSGLGRAASAGVGKTATASAANASQPDLTRDQLRSCVALDTRLTNDAAALAKQKRTLEDERTGLEARFADQDAKRAKLDRTSAVAASRLNAALDEIERRAKAHDREVDAFNIKLAAFERDRNMFAAGCAGKTYRESDMQAIKAESGHPG